MDEKKIKLTDLLEVCLNFKRDPSKINQLKLTEMTAALICREYLPVAEKKIALVLILNSVTAGEEDAIELEQKLHIGKIVFGLMSYVVNLENNLSNAALKEEIVDLLFETGIADEIYSKCSKDFNRLCEMVTEALNFSNIFKIVSVTSLYNNDNLTEFINEVRSMKKELTPEMLQNLKDIVIEGSPEFKTLKEGFIEKILGDVMDGDFNTLDQQPANVELNPKVEEEVEDKEEA